MTEASLGLQKLFFYPSLIILPFLPVHYATVPGIVVQLLWAIRVCRAQGIHFMNTHINNRYILNANSNRDFGGDSIMQHLWFDLNSG